MEFELSPEGAIDLAALVGHCATVNAADTVERVFETFRDTGVEFLAIVEGDRLLGMCSRHGINVLCSAGATVFRSGRGNRSRSISLLPKPGSL